MNYALLLTTLRLAMAPFFAWTFVKGYADGPMAGWLWAAAAILLASELSDAFDGVVARARGEVTDFGKVFDPVADSIARLTAFASFMVCGIIPLWLFLIFLYRDMLMALLRIVCASKGTVLAARNSGKAKAVFQGTSIGLVVIICLLQAYHAPFVGTRWLGMHPGFWLVAFSATITVLSVFDYLIPNWPKVVAMSTPAGSRRGGS